MKHVFDMLAELNNVGPMTCPKCGYEFLRRVQQPRKCPQCQVSFYRAREPWPRTGGPQDLPYEMVTRYGYERINFNWPRESDPKPKPDIDWQIQQNRLARDARERMGVKV